MQIINTSLHQINHSENKINKINISNELNDMQEYIKGLFDNIKDNNNKRAFDFCGNTTEIRHSLSLMLDEGFDSATEINALRLLRIEIQTQEKYSHITEVQKGILVQFLVENGMEKKIIISKADHNDFLDENDLKLRKGLPLKRRIFKAVVISFDQKNNIDSVSVYDTNSKMSEYWWKDYLELREKYTDTHNTQTSLNIFDLKIFNPIKKTYPVDYMCLRNSMIGYYRNHSQFKLDEFIELLFQNYEPEDQNFPIDKIIQKIQTLPNKEKGFDAVFNIEKKAIKKRMGNTITLAENMELIFKGHIDHLSDIIKAEEDEEGNKYIRIRTDNGYKYFKKSNE
jgi:hypothetical protein